MTKTVALVLAGGRGQRLWPLSRESRPKQFVPVVTENTLIATTVKRLLSVFDASDIFVSTTEKYRQQVLDAGLPIPAENIILEQRPMGPATAFLLAHAIIGRLYSEDVRVISCPSDHFVRDKEVFERTLAELSEGSLQSHAAVVALGATPTEPDDRLGYFLMEPSGTPDLFHVTDLIEKPPLDEAQRLVQAGSVCWNTAYYLARPVDVLHAMRSAFPEQTAEVSAYADAWVRDSSVRASGYAGTAVPGHELGPFVSEGADIDVLVRDFGWSDVGTWERVLQVRASASGANGASPLMPGSQEVVAISTDGRPIIACGVENLVIVSHEDAVYVLNRDAAGAAESINEWRSSVASADKDGLL